MSPDREKTMTITEFLEARIAEDEAVARAASGGTVVGSPGSWSQNGSGDEWAVNDGQLEVEVLVGLRPGLPVPPDVMGGRWAQVAAWLDAEAEDRPYALAAATHMARHDPARVLRECAAKRAIIANLSPFGGWDDMFAPEILGTLAAAYADHPDYQPEWKP